MRTPTFTEQTSPIGMLAICDTCAAIVFANTEAKSLHAFYHESVQSRIKTLTQRLSLVQNSLLRRSRS